MRRFDSSRNCVNDTEESCIVRAAVTKHSSHPRPSAGNPVCNNVSDSTLWSITLPIVIFRSFQEHLPRFGRSVCSLVTRGDTRLSSASASALMQFKTQNKRGRIDPAPLFVTRPLSESIRIPNAIRPWPVGHCGPFLPRWPLEDELIAIARVFDIDFGTLIEEVIDKNDGRPGVPFNARG